jgi:hypothetical protein
VATEFVAGSNSAPTSAQAPGKRARLIREKISQKVINELNERHERIVHHISEAAREAIEQGKQLTWAKEQMRHGKWLPFIARHLHFSERTVQRYMKAYERRRDLLSIDKEFMARIWGNEEKQLEEGKDVKKGKSDVDVGFEDESDSGDNDSGDSGGEELTRPAHISEESWSRMVVHRELIKQLEAYLNQPVAENSKLIMLVELYESVYAA